MARQALSDRALNRATLARQLLLRRAPLAPTDAVTHLVGLQAQNPLDPYLGLWSRLEHFEPAEVGRLLEDRTLVRIVVMRGTIHLVTASDALVMRPLFQVVLDREITHHSEFAPLLVGVDVAPMLRYARALLAERPSTGAQLRAALAEEFPDHAAPALAYACRCLLPLVQIPPRGVWGKVGAVTSTPVDAWVGRPLDAGSSIDDLLVRYLAAFGPATAADAASWSRLTGMREILERLGDRVVTFRDDHDRVLFDLPDAPRPSPDVEAPVRFLPEYDNVLLPHADRSRFGSDDDRRFSGAAGPYKGAVLVDGRGRGIWHSETDKKAHRSTIVVEHLPLTRAETAEVGAEAHVVGAFWHPTAEDVDVRLLPLA